MQHRYSLSLPASVFLDSSHPQIKKISEVINENDQFERLLYFYLLSRLLLRCAGRSAELLVLYERREKSYRRLIYKYKAHFSLDRDDGLQNEAAQFTPSAEDAYENNIIRQALFAGLSELTDKQLGRLYAHFFLDMSYMQIARIENVDESAVRRSISSALLRLRKKIQQFF